MADVRKCKASCGTILSVFNNLPLQTTTNPLTIKTLIHKLIKAIFILRCVGSEGRRRKYKEKVSNCSIVKTENFRGRTDINNLRNTSERRNKVFGLQQIVEWYFSDGKRLCKQHNHTRSPPSNHNFLVMP